MTDLPPPTVRLTVDATALAHNWRTLDAMSGMAAAGAAIKADCYGLGTDTCLPVLRDAGAGAYFVAHWSEVPGAIAHVPAAKVSVLHGPTNDREVAFARATGVKPVINSLAQASRWTESGGGPCDLMVDTGINRLGLSMSEIGDPLVSRLEVDTLMSHLACADEDTSMNAQQLARFHEAAKAISAQRLSLANSAGIALGTEYHFDVTRPGLALYGGVQRSELRGSIRQVATLDAALLQVRQIAAGECVGYNATFTAREPMRIGVACLGYADGFLRSWAGSALRHEGVDLPILGKVSMDMIVVDLGNAEQLREGDWVAVPYDLPAAAQASGLSQYELLTVLGKRLRR